MIASGGDAAALDPGEVQLWIVPTAGGQSVAARLQSQLSMDER